MSANPKNGRRSGPGERDRRAHWSHAVSGFILGLLLFFGQQALLGGSLLNGTYLPVLVEYLAPLLWGVAGAALALTRARVLLWITGAAICTATLGVAYTPVVRPLLRSVTLPPDRLAHADAVVVLSSGIQDSGNLTPDAQSRLLRGYEILRAGLAPRLVLTRLPSSYPSYRPAVQRQMLALGLRYPIEEAGPVRNTHDEALAVARLARERGWPRVILVSEPAHMRRASAVFRKAGLPVLRAPCVEETYDAESLSTPFDRLRAFDDWLHEVIGYQVYRMRGWI